ncbi:MAG: S41 family peptidase [Bacilli bacterium]|nr:S41 family peptidase [Bacilli bacterium]
MRKEDKKTKDKLEQLSLSIGEIEIKKDDKEYKEQKYKDKKHIQYIYSSSFKTSEIIILLLITSIVSVFMGGLVVYKINANSGKYLDKELQDLIKNYQYITENYYEKVDKNKLVDSAIQGMLSNLDKNSNFLGSDEDNNFNMELQGSYKGIGVQVYLSEEKKVTVHSVFDGSPADKAGLKVGDILIKVNDESLEGKNTEEASNVIKAQKGDFDITFVREGQEKTVKIKLSTVDLPSVVSKVIERNDKKIGYIYTSIFAENTFKQFKKELNKLEKDNIDGLIIDLRDNSGGHLTTAEDILSLFLDSTHPIYQIKGQNKNSKYYSKGKRDKKYKVVMLVNGGSASASELTTSAMKEQYGATIVGLKTYGKGTVQELQTLPSGNQYKLTTKTWVTSKGKEVNEKGIEPDIEVSLDENYSNDPKEENDNQLQKAIEEILK